MKLEFNVSGTICQTIQVPDDFAYEPRELERLFNQGVAITTIVMGGDVEIFGTDVPLGTVTDLDPDMEYTAFKVCEIIDLPEEKAAPEKLTTSMRVQDMDNPEIGIEMRVMVAEDCIATRPEGYGCCGIANGEASPIEILVRDGHPVIRYWPDIDTEDFDYVDMRLAKGLPEEAE